MVARTRARIFGKFETSIEVPVLKATCVSVSCDEACPTPQRSAPNNKKIRPRFRIWMEVGFTVGCKDELGSKFVTSPLKAFGNVAFQKLGHLWFLCFSKLRDGTLKKHDAIVDHHNAVGHVEDAEHIVRDNN